MSKTAALMLVLVFLTASCVIVPLPVKAGSKTLVVPDDYATIGEAVRAAAEGDLIFVKNGTYNEQTLTINKTLSLKGESIEDTVITFHPPLYFVGWQGVTPMYTYNEALTIYANDVEISGFTISAELTTEAPADLSEHTLGQCDPPFSATGGAHVLSTGNNTKITGNTIQTGLLIEGSNQTIAENTLTGHVTCKGSSNKVFSNLITGLSILVEGFANEIHANNISGVYNGIQVIGEAHVIAGNNITNCKYGMSVYYTTLGVVGSNNVFYGNRLTQNVNGIVVTGGNNNTFFGNELIDNTVGVTVETSMRYQDLPKPNATFYHNNFVGSVQQVNLSTSSAGFFDYGGEGNYWNDYTGLDSNVDGIGDTPYVIDDNRRDNYPLMLPFDIENNSIVIPSNTPSVPNFNLLAASIAALVGVIVVVTCLLVYYKKRKSLDN
ncbi:hypothetical protein JXA31_09690 [Candidatus Bathyarchaeota archaeon]|nr:hypothetical protein [Candidatus Bathyarchaeota archaeon]